ncbi:MAG: hypothetical protein KJ776_15970 [Proteobacteria bacterium]|nr:hypothetical protein [Pseudomonadota bacterium]
MLAAALAGCATGTGSGGASGSYDCLGTPIPADAVTDPRPATELDEDGRAALRGLEVPTIDPVEWTIASAGPEQVVLLRKLAEPEDLGAGDVRTHERMVISIVDAPNIPNSPAWMLSAHGTCALATDTPGAGTATVTLDPAQPPDPASTDVPLLVTERACNSGLDAEGRIEVASLRETDAVVEVIITVRPRGGGQDCQGNPPTPFTLTLDEPLGDRDLLDASVAPPRFITTE